EIKSRLARAGAPRRYSERSPRATEEAPMRINGHAHIFNLRTVLTPHAVKVMTNRVRTLGVPGFVADALEEFLAEQVLRPEHLVEEELLARFLALIRQSAAFREFARTTAGLPVEVRLLGDGLPALET